MIDLGVHLIDQAFYFLDDSSVSTVTASIFQLYGPKGQGFGTWGRSCRPGSDEFTVEDQADIAVVMKSGVEIKIELAWASEVKKDEQQVRFIGSKGRVEYQNDEAPSLSLDANSPPSLRLDNEAIMRLERTVHLLNKQFTSIFDYFIHALREGVNLNIDLERALQIQRVIDAAYLSAKSSSTIKLEEL